VKSILPESRDTILVGHAIYTELRLLEMLRIPLTFKCIVDTQGMAQEVFPELEHSPSLKALEKILGIPVNYNHCAGNDAHVTLVVALGLACLHPDPGSNSESWHEFCSLFEKLKDYIAKSLPLVAVPRVKGCRKANWKECKRMRRFEIAGSPEDRKAFRAAKKPKPDGFDGSEVLHDLDSLYDVDGEIDLEEDFDFV